MRKRAFLVAATFAILLWRPVSAASRFEKVLPDDTLAFVSVRDVTALQEKLKGYAYYDLWQEPSVQRFVETKGLVESADGPWHPYEDD